MEIVYLDKKQPIFKENIISGFYGDILDLVKMDVDIGGIIYDDNWSVKRFLNGFHIRLNKRILSIFKYLEIDIGLLKKRLGDLSKTDFRFVLLAKMLLINKSVIVFDYFETGLTYKDQKRLIKIIRLLKKDGKTIVIISKDLVFLSQVVDDILVINDGCIVYNGSINELVLSDNLVLSDVEIIKFIKLANKKGARLDKTLDSKELLKDIYRSVY